MSLSIQAINLQTTSAAGLLIAGFLALLFVGSLWMPGRIMPGAQEPNGTRRPYRLNGLALFLFIAVLAGITQGLGWGTLAGLYVRFFPLLAAANLLAFALTAWLFLQGRQKDAEIRQETGLLAITRRAFLGAELNPTWFGVNLKFFSYRPSLIGLALLNASFAAAQYENYGTLSDAMWLYQIFTFVYVLNYFQFEDGILYTWDMIAERFGWMLIWGDYVLVPFFYSIPGWYLVDNVQTLPTWASVALCLLFAVGFWLFRGANEQKHRFKLDPATRIWGKPAETIGGRLLVSGFWGIGRHLNYTGEICIYTAFTLTTRFVSPIPYLLLLWLVVLLVHRSWRDDVRCREKYGDLWSRYTERARFRLLPFVY